MKKKIYTKIAATLGVLLVCAASGQANSIGGVKTGFYAGISAGLSNLSGGQSFGESVTTPAPVDSRHIPLSANSFAAGILGGYGYRHQCYWLAAELSYLFDKLESKHTNNVQGERLSAIWKTRSTGAFGGSFHLGYLPHENYTLYGIIGFEYRRFQMSMDDPNTNPAPSIENKFSKKYGSLAFVPGVGVLVKLAKNVSLKGEYKYAFHRSKTLTASVPSQNAAPATANAVFKNNPRVQTFQVGLVYNF